MKEIVTTEKVKDSLGDTKKIIYHYKDGTKREINPQDRRTSEDIKEVLIYTIERFNKLP